MFDDVVTSELIKFADEDKKAIFPRFFKTGKGEYGEGDKFLGVTVPNVRIVAKQHLDAEKDDITLLLASQWNEVRLCALLIMVEKHLLSTKRSWINRNGEKAAETLQKQLFELYLSHTDRINNWNLVDLSAPVVVGDYLLGRSHDVLYRLANSNLLWDQRIAVVSTSAFIRHGDLKDIFSLSELMLHNPHDLMHKAIGWMLREAGKQDKAALEAFLDRYACEMPRTMLRYSIEKFPEEERKRYLQKK
jgi:3-methyladenine DNA glycosylase AlkD